MLRGILVAYETVRRWVSHFGPLIAADLRKHRSKPQMTWHLDEVISRSMVWRAVDAEGEVLDVLVQTMRNRRAALKSMRKLLKKYGFVPDKLVTMICDLTVQRRGILGSQNAMNAVDGATIERRIRINRPDDENTRCKVSRAWDPRKDFSQCMPQPRTPSASNASHLSKNAPILQGIGPADVA